MGDRDEEDRAPWADGSEGETEIDRGGREDDEGFDRVRKDAADLIRVLAAIGADTADEAIGRVNRWKRAEDAAANGVHGVGTVAGLAALVGRVALQHGVEMVVTIKPKGDA